VSVDDDVTLRGGYDSTCSSRSEDPGATVLTHGGGGDLRLVTTKDGFQGNGFLRIERLTFRAVGRIRIRLETIETPDTYLSLSRVWVDQSAGIVLESGAEAFVHSSLFTRNGACPLWLANYTFNGNPRNTYFERARVGHSTFADNGGPGLCVGRPDYEDDDWRLDLVNSVFWDNADADIRLDNQGVATIDAVLRNNLYTTLQSGRALRTTPTGTLSGNPQFVNAAAADWRLAGGSPAINTGRLDVALLEAEDFAGGPRWYGTAPDRGAYESAIGSTATVLNVTTAADSGPGSLRQALIDANASPDLNRIRFAIGSSCGPRLINLASLLPDIVHPLIIEGYSQPGASANTAVLGTNAVICVIVNGGNQITGAYGLNVNTGASADATVAIEGLAFSGHAIAAVQFAGGRDHRLSGVQVGGTVGAIQLLPSATGVRVAGATRGVRIGGPEPADRNLIVDATGIGINVSGSGSTQPGEAVIENNYVGTQSGGDVRGNQRGILLRGFDAVVRGNVVANSASHGIELDGALAMANRIEGNRIGIPAACATCADRGNSGHGVLLRNGADGNRVNDNRIGFSGLDGVAVAAARQNTIRRNDIHDNVGPGIDLGDDGIDYFGANNAQPAPPGAGNDAQNKPALTALAGDAGTAWAAGTLDSANGWYRIDFYGASTCPAVVIGSLPLGNWGQGRDWLGSTFVQVAGGSASANGSGGFQGVPLQRAGAAAYFSEQRRVMATATRLSASPLLLAPFRDLGTSEFGRCRSFVFGIGDRIFADGFQAP
jgi:hypothetical protein